MNLTELKAVGVKKKSRKRIGRGPGSGMGKTASRGSKGHTARTGWARRRSFEGGQTPLFRKLPIKGFKNGRFKKEYLVINVSALNVYKDGDKVGIVELMQKGVVHKNANNESTKVKLLGDGDLERKVDIQVNAISKSAKEKIEAKGGSVEIIK
jgi:large subunit ribosomal protein L15